MDWKPCDKCGGDLGKHQALMIEEDMDFAGFDLKPGEWAYEWFGGGWLFFCPGTPIRIPPRKAS